MSHCLTCKFWGKYRNHGIVVYDVRQDTPALGYCRYSPPKTGLFQNNWPTTTEDDWCGQYEQVSASDGKGPLSKGRHVTHAPLGPINHEGGLNEYTKSK